MCAVLFFETIAGGIMPAEMMFPLHLEHILRPSPFQNALLGAVFEADHRSVVMQGRSGVGKTTGLAMFSVLGVH